MVAFLNGKHPIQFLSYTTGTVKAVAPSSSWVLCFAGRCILYTQFDQSGSDLMLVDNFR